MDQFSFIKHEWINYVKTVVVRASSNTVRTWVWTPTLARNTEIMFVWIRRLTDFKRKNVVVDCSCNGQTQTTRHCRWDNYPAKESSMSDTKRLHILLAFLYSSTAIPCDFLEKFLALKLEFLLKLRETNRWAWTVYVIATIPNWNPTRLASETPFIQCQRWST